MNLVEIEQEALAVPDRERASLAARLLDPPSPPGTEVSDEAVGQRERDLDSGKVAVISHEKFVRRVKLERGRCGWFATPIAAVRSGKSDKGMRTVSG